MVIYCCYGPLTLLLWKCILKLNTISIVTQQWIVCSESMDVRLLIVINILHDVHLSV